NFISVVIAQGFDTTVFAFLGLYGLVESVWQIILVATAVKLITIALASPIMVLARQAYKLCKQF
ncbi:hypothetical protein KAU11_02320, partial [Candidatus Babeliales bacterium]|nr:hypothetical protein [Candidatus Babeliales bacterium]